MLLLCATVIGKVRIVTGPILAPKELFQLVGNIRLKNSKSYKMYKMHSNLVS